MRLHLPPAALAKAKALSVVAAALSVGGVGGVVALSQVADTSTTPVTATADATPAPTDSPTGPPAANPTTSPSGSPSASQPTAVSTASPTSTYVLPSCPAGVKNHGAYVSSVAHSAPKGDGGRHGSWVSEAARSNCGQQPAKASEAPHPATTDHPESRSPKPVKTAHSTSGEQHGHKHGG